MRRWEEREVVLKERVLTARFCDVCGFEIKNREAVPLGPAVWDITIEATSTMSAGPEAEVQRIAVDCCGVCWPVILNAINRLNLRHPVRYERSTVQLLEDGE